MFFSLFFKVYIFLTNYKTIRFHTPTMFIINKLLKKKKKQKEKEDQYFFFLYLKPKQSLNLVLKKKMKKKLCSLWKNNENVQPTFNFFFFNWWTIITRDVNFSRNGDSRNLCHISRRTFGQGRVSALEQKASFIEYSSSCKKKIKNILFSESWLENT